MAGGWICSPGRKTKALVKPRTAEVVLINDRTDLSPAELEAMKNEMLDGSLGISKLTRWQ